MDTNIIQYTGTKKRHIINMSKAIGVGRLSPCLKREVGVVVVDSMDKVVSSGVNGVHELAECRIQNHCVSKEGLACESIHAESMAIMKLARIPLHGYLTMYCSHEPCIQCCLAISMCKIDELVLQKPYKNHKGIELLKREIKVTYLEE